MHTEARRFVETAAKAFPIRQGVAEFGSRNVNGTAREIVPHEAWWGIDVAHGVDVDEVANAATWDGLCGFPIDTVICMECLEHTPEAKEIVANAYRLLIPEGIFIMTCAGPDRTPHSCLGSLDIGDEFYRNVSRDEMSSWLEEAGFSDFMVKEGPSESVATGPRGDTYAVALKK